MKNAVLLTFLFVIGSFAACTDTANHSSEIENLNSSIQANEASININRSKENLPSSPANDSTGGKEKMFGCWSGMRGGMVKITDYKIYDFGSDESSRFHLVLEKEKTGTELEEYLLEADSDFPRSFLAKFIRLKFQSDNYLYITTYDTFEKYKIDKLSGEGTFGRLDCAEFQKSINYRRRHPKVFEDM